MTLKKWVEILGQSILAPPSIIRMLALICLTAISLAGTFVSAEENERGERSQFNTDKLVSIWAEPKSNLAAKLIHQIATDLRLNKSITITFNLFSGYKGTYYLLDTYADLMEANRSNALPDAAILPLDVAFSLSAHLPIYHLSTDIVPERSIAPELIELVREEDGFIGVPIFDGHHLVLFRNKNLMTRTNFDWHALQAIESRADLVGINALTWQAGSLRAFCSIMICNESDIEENLISKFNQYRQLVRAFKYPLYCAQKCKSNLCEYQCSENAFHSLKVAMMVDSGSHLPTARKQLSNKLSVSSLTSLNGIESKQLRYPEVLVFFGESFSAERLAVMKAIVGQFLKVINQRGMHTMAGLLPARKKARSRVLDRLGSNQQLIMDRYLSLMIKESVLASSHRNFFNREFGHIFRKFLTTDMPAQELIDPFNRMTQR